MEISRLGMWAVVGLTLLYSFAVNALVEAGFSKVRAPHMTLSHIVCGAGQHSFF